MTDLSVADSARASTLRFSTATFAPRERTSAWCEAYGRTIARLELDPISDGPFEAAATMSALPGLGMVSTVTGKLKWSIPKSLVSADDLIFVTVHTGGWECCERGRDISLKAGQAAFCFNSDAARGITGGHRSMLRVPLRSIAPMLGGVAPNIDRPIPADSPPLRLLSSYTRTLHDSGMTPELQRTAVTHIHDLLALLVGANRDAAELAKVRGVPAARLHALMCAIDEYLTDPELSAEWIGRKLGLSYRYVHHLLEGSGASFSELVRSKRVERARRMLERPSATMPRIIDVAYAVGFNDLSTFNRAFRRHFGCAPSDVLRRH